MQATRSPLDELDNSYAVHYRSLVGEINQIGITFQTEDDPLLHMKCTLDRISWFFILTEKALAHMHM